MNVESKVKIYKTVVRPILSAEKRADTKKTNQKISNVEMKTVRI